MAEQLDLALFQERFIQMTTKLESEVDKMLFAFAKKVSDLVTEKRQLHDENRALKMELIKTQERIDHGKNTPESHDCHEDLPR